MKPTRPLTNFVQTYSKPPMNPQTKHCQALWKRFASALLHVVRRSSETGDTSSCHRPERERRRDVIYDMCTVDSLCVPRFTILSGRFLPFMALHPFANVPGSLTCNGCPESCMAIQTCSRTETSTMRLKHPPQHWCIH